jgi:uncharacterized protein YjbI with pentapeptide repeats
LPDLIRADLSMVDLRWADLSGACLIEANLSGADLTGANLREADLSKADLSGACLIEANLSGADFSRADLSGACLIEANLSGADLIGANLREADLSKADLSGACLIEANLIWADLSKADLSEADLRLANLGWANLSGAYLSGALIGWTVFASVDLREVEGLDKVHHIGPSTIGIDTIYLSQGEIPEVFLRGAGVPDDFIKYMHSLTGKALQFYSCFISYSEKDRDFVERLYADLQSKGVRTWYFPKDAKWGEYVWGEIDRAIKIYDKIVVVCSRNSLQSGPVLREIERALQREDRENNKNILFPITIDDYVFNEWKHARRDDVVSRVAGIFKDWRDPSSYQKAFRKLLEGLQAESSNTSREQA